MENVDQSTSRDGLLPSGGTEDILRSQGYLMLSLGLVGVLLWGVAIMGLVAWATALLGEN